MLLREAEDAPLSDTASLSPSGAQRVLSPEEARDLVAGERPLTELAHVGRFPAKDDPAVD